MLISPEQAILKLLKDPNSVFIDLRSEKEFNSGHISSFVNSPILNNEERHWVGIEYKKFGQEKAIDLGLELTRENIKQKIQSWVNIANSKDILFTCARGGLRSKFAEEFLKEQGVCSDRVEKGYKALRNYLIPIASNFSPSFVLSGKTGTGKTELIQEFSQQFIDLEKLANHRGSIFGASKERTQPSQATFENNLAIEILKKKNFAGVEDESLRIGQVSLPISFKENMKVSPVVILECEQEERIHRIHEEYVKDIPVSELIECLSRIKKHLGGSLFNEICSDMENGHHFDWIKKILVQYYDKKYDYAFLQQNRKVLFKGNYNEVKKFLSSSDFFSEFQPNSSPMISATL